MTRQVLDPARLGTARSPHGGAPARLAKVARSLAVSVLLALPCNAFAGQFEQSPAATQHLEAIEAQRAKLREMGEQGPLVFRRVLFIAEIPERYGEYVPRAGNAFGRGEKILIYVEPVGLVWKREDDVYGLNIIVDFAIQDADGRIIADAKDFGRISIRNRERASEIMTYLGLTITDAEIGSYAAVVTYRDANSEKAASFRLPFSVRDGAAIAPVPAGRN